jgi:hypothetical protein
MKRTNDNYCDTNSKRIKTQYKSNDQIIQQRGSHEHAFFAVMGSRDLFLYITAFQKGKKYKDWVDGNKAIKFGYLSLLQLKLESIESMVFTTSCALEPIQDGNLPMLKWIKEHIPKFLFNYHLIDTSAIYGRLDITKWLHENTHCGCTVNAMNWSASIGHLETVIWLHENRTEGCTTDAMDRAATNGHLEIVKWLYNNRKECCTIDAVKIAMAAAVQFGHLEILKFLHKTRTIHCAEGLFNISVEEGHYKIAHYLFTYARLGRESKYRDLIENTIKKPAVIKKRKYITLRKGSEFF